MLPWALPSWTPFGTCVQASSQKWFFSNPTVFPAVQQLHISFATAGPSPSCLLQTCPTAQAKLPAPLTHLGEVHSTISLAQHWMVTTLAQRCLTVMREVKTEHQMQEHPQLPFPLSRLMPQACAGKQPMRMREEGLLTRCLPSHWDQPPELLDVQSGTEMQQAWGSAALPQEPSTSRIKKQLFYPG